MESHFESFCVGVASSIAAYYVINYIQYMVRKVEFKIEGDWAEFVPDSKGRRFSFGRIYFDKTRNMFAFDGTNFLDNGNIHCHWETVASHLDVSLKKFYYMFTAQVGTELDKVYYGFGVINLGKDAVGAYVPVDGYYISANVDEKSMSHSMRRTEEIRYQRGDNGRAIVRLLSSVPDVN